MMDQNDFVLLGGWKMDSSVGRSYWCAVVLIDDAGAPGARIASPVSAWPTISCLRHQKFFHLTWPHCPYSRNSLQRCSVMQRDWAEMNEYHGSVSFISRLFSWCRVRCPLPWLPHAEQDNNHIASCDSLINMYLKTNEMNTNILIANRVHNTCKLQNLIDSCGLLRVPVHAERSWVCLDARSGSYNPKSRIDSYARRKYTKIITARYLTLVSHIMQKNPKSYCLLFTLKIIDKE